MVCSQRHSEQNASIGINHGLAPSSRQAIIWNHDDQVYWRIYASIDLDLINAKKSFRYVLKYGRTGALSFRHLPAEAAYICLNKIEIWHYRFRKWFGAGTSVSLLLTGSLRISFIEILIKIQLSYKKINLKISSMKCPSFCLDFNVFTQNAVFLFFIDPADSNNNKRWDTMLSKTWSQWWFIHQWPVNSPHKGPVTRKMFSTSWCHHVLWNT